MADDPELSVRWQNIPDSAAPRGLTEWSIETDYFTSTDSFSLRYYDPEPSRLQGLELEPVELVLGDSQQLLGRVDVSVNHGDGTIELQGRDYIADMVECNVDPTFAINKDELLGDSVKNAAKTVGIKAVVADADLQMRNIRTGVAAGSPSPKTFNALRLSEYKPEPGQGIYDFLNKICSRHGCTMQPGSSRNTIVLGAPNYDQKPSAALFRSRDANVSIVSGVATRDYSSFPTFALFVGKGVGKGGSTDDIRASVPIAEYISGGASGSEMRAIVNERSVAGRVLPKDGRDADGQLYRLLYFKDEKAKNQAQIDRATYRAIGERMKESLVYEVTVQGHFDRTTGAIWTVDTVCDVNDELCGVAEPLWIKGRRLRLVAEQQGGRTTSMTMIRPHSILLEVA